MEPCVFVDQKALWDPRFTVLGMALGGAGIPPHRASNLGLGVMVEVWAWCMKRRTQTIPRNILTGIGEHEEFPQMLLDADLARESEAGSERLYICGIKEKLRFLAEIEESLRSAEEERARAREWGRMGGKLSAKRPRDERGRLLPKALGGPLQGGLDETRGSSKALGRKPRKRAEEQAISDPAALQGSLQVVIQGGLQEGLQGPLQPPLEPTDLLTTTTTDLKDLVRPNGRTRQTRSLPFTHDQMQEAFKAGAGERYCIVPPPRELAIGANRLIRKLEEDGVTLEDVRCAGEYVASWPKWTGHIYDLAWLLEKDRLRALVRKAKQAGQVEQDWEARYREQVRELERRAKEGS